jgi:streptogramin lyase
MIKYTLRLFAVLLIAVFISGMFGCNRKEWISPTHVADSTILAGSDSAGLVNGPGATARFNHPFGLTLDTAGNLYITDQGNSVIRKMDKNGMVTTFAGIGGKQGYVNGADSVATFYRPFGIASDVAGNIYVADAGNNVIRGISPAGTVSTFAGIGIAGASNMPDSISFNSPLGVAVDGNGNVYVADYENDIIRKITPAGVASTLAGFTGTPGAVDGLDTAARFNLPESVAVDAAGNVYVADNGNNLIRKVTPGGQVTTIAGSGNAGSANGQGTAASFNSPFGIALDASENIYVADSGNNLIRKISPTGAVTTFAGSGAKGAGNATGASATFNTPSGVAVDAAGNVYVADENNNLIRKITAAGVVSTIAVKSTKTSIKLRK